MASKGFSVVNSNYNLRSQTDDASAALNEVGSNQTEEIYNSNSIKEILNNHDDDYLECATVLMADAPSFTNQLAILTET